ncbi:RNA polymerase sigma factor [Lignipirellula cremea]|uniref:RNA polymerase sigma factor n=1 Tax=Lignipirellula cremea TaxID=2528010 RepID=A0A518DWE3_9BACT|nr:RNA polymerase sigma factor [Lignipirellula cremea]QDU96149.1 RNA polymerase sigma factor [Lignipirellula cremea]
MDDSHLLPPNHLNATNSRLLSAARADDPDSWRELTGIYSPVVRFWITRAGIRSKSDVADILQDVFIAVANNLRTFQREQGIAKFRAWLKAVTQSKINDHFRGKGKHPDAVGGSAAAFQLGNLPAKQSEEESDGAAENEWEQPEKTILTQAALASLRSEFRENTWKAFWRTAVDGCNATEVADELGVSSASVRKAKSRVLQRLREVLAELGLE